MAYNTNIPIITSGLTFSIDPANSKSYVSGNTSVSDLSRATTGGTLVNGVSFSGDSFVFDGVNDYIDFGNILKQYLTGALINFSINFWVYKEQSTLEMLLSSYDTDITQVSMYLGFFNDGVRFLTSPNGSGTNLAVAQTNDSFSSNTWHNVVITQNGSLGDSGINVIVNGVVRSFTKSGTANFGTVFNGSKPHNLGRRDQAASFAYFKGKIGGFNVYNRALSTSEILQNYNATKWRYQ